MKTCPECRNLVTSDTIACKHCGHIFDGEEPAQNEMSSPISKANRKWWLNISIFIASLLVLIIVVFVFWLNSPNDGDKEPKADIATTTEAIVMCKRFVKDYYLKAPSTAKFQSSFQANSNEISPNTFQVISYVDAQNSFGANIRVNYICQARYDGDGRWSLLDLQTDE